MTAKKSTKTSPKKTVKKAAKKDAAAKLPEVKNGADKPVVTTTVAHQVHHAETVQAIEQGNKDVTSEIKHDGTALSIARLAWREVKGAGDPELDHCVPPHQDKFLSHAQAILEGGQPLSGDTQIARFEQAVARLRNA